MVSYGKHAFQDLRCANPRSYAHAVTDLTPREFECLDLCACGHTDTQIAQKLGVTHHAVRFHIGNIMKKLGARNRTHAVAIVMLRLLG